MRFCLVASVMVAVVTTAAPPARAQAPRAEVNAIRGIVVEETADSTVIVVRGSAHPTFNVFKLADPVRLFVDVANGDVSGADSTIDVDNGVVGQIGTLQFRNDGTPIGRVIIGLTKDATYRVDADGSSIRVVVDGAGRAAGTGPDTGALRAEHERVRAAVDRERDLLQKLKLERLKEEQLRTKAAEQRRAEEALREQMEAARASAEGARASEQASVDALRAERDSLARTVAEQERVQRSLSEALPEQEATRKAEEARLAQLAQEIEAQRARVLEREATLSASLRAKERALVELEGAWQAKKRENEELQSDVGIQEARVRALRDDLDKEQRRLSEVTAARQKEEAKVASLRQELDAGRGELARVREDLVAAEKARAEAARTQRTDEGARQAEVARLEGVLAQKEQEVARLADALDRARVAEAEVHRLQGELQETKQSGQKEIVQKEQAISRLEGELEAARSASAEAQRASDALQAELAATRQVSGKAGKDAKARLTAALKAASDAKAAAGRLEQELGVARKASDDAARARAELDAAVKARDARIVELESSLGEQASKLAKLDAERARIEDQARKDALSDSRALAAKVAALEARLAQEKARAGAAGPAVKDLERQLRDERQAGEERARAAEKAVAARLADLEQRLSLAEAQRGDRASVERSYQEEISRLRARIDASEAALGASDTKIGKMRAAQEEALRKAQEARAEQEAASRKAAAEMEAARQAREQAERDAEAARLAREEAARLAGKDTEAARQAREQAERDAEAARQAREEAARLAGQDTEAARHAREQAERDAEAARTAKVTAARQAELDTAAARVAREQAERDAEAARAAREEAARVAGRESEAARMAREQAAREAEAARAARHEAARLAGLDTAAARAARDQAERDAEAARLARAEADRMLAAARSQAGARVSAATVPVARIDFREDAGRSQVEIGVTPDTRYEVIDQSGSQAVLLLRDVALPSELRRSLDVSDFHGSVTMVSSFESTEPSEQGAVRVVVNLRNPVSNRLRREKDTLVWEFDRSTAVTPPPVAGTRSPASVPPPAPPTSGVRYYPNVVSQAAAAPAADVSYTPINPTFDKRKKKKRYTGKRINLTIKDADIQHVLTFLAKEGRVNIIAGEDVSGRVTFHLEDIPWDLALDMILRTKGLDYVKEEGIYRVAPIDTIKKEIDDEIEKRKKKVDLKPLYVRLIPVNYGKASALAEQVDKIRSPKGSVSTDDRTNTLIIKDIEDHIIAAEDLVRRLDTQTPQVLIEARIVEASSSFTRDVGIQWGGNFAMSPAFGNETGLSFPSIVGISGGATGRQALTDGLYTNQPGFAVNLPAPAGQGSGGAIGFTLGNLSQSANINLRLSAAEEEGFVKIVSSPKISTLDNAAATIRQGVSIPISVVSAQGVNTQFFNAELKLEVTPHVTQDGTIAMKIDISKNEPDFGRTGANGNPTIQKKEAHTELLLRDGDTTVIGGIYTRNQGTNYSKVPLLGDIPILGWLFKTRSETDQRSELLIFLTPRIINRQASVAAP
ncbi:MAG: hypothetical protein AMXMBFR64_01440 [Myxococcales bacterium]